MKARHNNFTDLCHLDLIDHECEEFVERENPYVEQCTQERQKSFLGHEMNSSLEDTGDWKMVTVW